jgi:hypothetical protein
LNRREVEEEYRRLLRDDVDNNESGESDESEGVEDSPDQPQPAKQEARISATAARRHITKPIDTLDLSPGTAANLLSRLEIDDGTTTVGILRRHAKAADDTVILKPKTTTTVPVQSVFAQPAAQPHLHQPKQVVIRSVDTQAPVAAAPKTFAPVLASHNSYVWPSKSSKMFFAEGLDGKKRARYVVLKNKSLYICKSESQYRNNKEPLRAFDVDNLLRCNLVRDNSGVLLGPKFELRLHFQGQFNVVCIGADSESTLLDWKRALLDSAPHLSVDGKIN